MWKRRWIWFGELVSDQSCALRYGNRSVTYRDERGSFDFGLEDGFLFGPPMQVDGTPVQLSEPERSAITERVLEGLRADGHDARVYGSQVRQS